MARCARAAARRRPATGVRRDDAYAHPAVPRRLARTVHAQRAVALGVSHRGLPHASRVRGGARRGRSTARRGRLHRECDRLGRHAGLSPPLVEVRLCDRRGDGHGAARRRADVEVGAGADPAFAGGGEGGGRRDRLRRRHGSSRADAVGDAGRGASCVRGAGRLRRERRRARHPDGEPRWQRPRARPTIIAPSTVACSVR